MRRTKKRPLKKGEASTETQNSFADALKQPLSRFLFNINLIEQRVRSEPSNGLVVNCVTGKYEFDPELCTARSEDELMASVRRLSSHEPKVGSAMLSSLAPDPDEKDETVLSQWRALNKQFDKQMMCSSSNNKENQKQQRNIVKRKGSIIKKREPFSTWALNDPLSGSSSNSSPTTSSANLSLNIKQLDCSNSSAAASKKASSSAAPLLPSVVRPVYKKRKLWALKFPSSPPSSSSSSLVPMPSNGPSSSSASAAPVANSSSIGKNNTNKLIRHCLSSPALVSSSSSSCSSSSKSRHFSKSYKK